MFQLLRILFAHRGLVVRDAAPSPCGRWRAPHHEGLEPHPESLTQNRSLAYQVLASRRESRRILAIRTQASALAMDASKSLASLRLRPNHANVRSTTQRLGRRA